MILKMNLFGRVLKSWLNFNWEKFQGQKKVRNLHGGGKIGTSVNLAFEIGQLPASTHGN